MISRKIWFLEEVLIFQKAKSKLCMNYRLLKNIRDIQFTVKLSKRWWQKKSMDPCQKSENFARENHQIQPQTCFFFTWNAGLLAYLVYRSRKTFYIWRFFDILKKCMKNVLLIKIMTYFVKTTHRSILLSTFTELFTKTVKSAKSEKFTLNKNISSNHLLSNFISNK